MRANAVIAEEQYRLVMECRTSDQTDYQWCLEHDIKPDTFYNWVRRLRRTGICDIPDAARFRKTLRQEVVRVEIAAPVSGNPDPDRVSSGTFPGHLPIHMPVMEVIVNDAAIRIPNGTDPALLECAIRMLREPSC